jgi:lipopolysaccharide/colanic/teichoic acid biosynthesis glycosyltransferase
VQAGDMSLVGPRPHIPQDYDRYHDADAALFDEWLEATIPLKPGIFGLSQLFRRSQREITPKSLQMSMVLDIMYANHATLLGDVAIIAGTPLTLPVALALEALNIIG